VLYGWLELFESLVVEVLCVRKQEIDSTPSFCLLISSRTKIPPQNSTKLAALLRETKYSLEIYSICLGKWKVGFGRTIEPQISPSGRDELSVDTNRKMMIIVRLFWVRANNDVVDSLMRYGYYY
jgi:hypothetical protein